MTVVHQLLPAASPNDAVTNQAFAWRDLLTEWGHDGLIVAEHVHPDVSSEVLRLDKVRKELNNGKVILRYSIYSKTADVARAEPARVGLVYHNITPGKYLRPYNQAVADLCDQGRQALASFGPPPAVLIADSSFNAADLREAGLGDAEVIPLLLDVPTRAPRNARHGDPIVLTVGRVVPNKRIDDVIKAFALYQRHRAPEASLAIVGSHVGFENYRLALDRLVEKIGVDRVFFTGPISGAARNAWYRRAHAYLSMSVHEGFCAPLIEALSHGTPVVARAAGAMPETLGSAGIVLEGDDLPLVAEALHEVVSSESTRLALAAAADERLAELSPEAIAPRIRRTLAPLLEES
ncbi:MAG: glycosyltransferase [Actinobacteria bacterium]|nr:glycosyltransferase [Actinomycetota bacterium]